MKNSSTDQHMDSLPSLSEIYGDSQRFANIFRWLTILIMMGIIGGIPIVLTTNNGFAASALALGLIPVFAVFYLIQHKKFERAAVFLAVVLITLNTVLATNGLGIHHLSNIAYPAILIIASLVISKRTMALLTLFALASIAWLVFGELSGAYTPAVLVRSVPGDFLSAAAILVITALMMRRVSETFFRNNLQLQKELSERKLAEEKYRNIFENAIDGIFQSTTDGRFVSVNPAMARMYGYDSPEQMLQTVTNIASQIYVEPELRNVFRRRLANGERVTGFESQEYRRDGSTLWTSINAQAIHDMEGNILYYEGTVEDITLRKEMEIKQKEAEILYRSLVEQTSIVVYRDAPDESASALYVSPQIKTLLGYSADEWLGDPLFWKKQIHPQDLQRVLADIKRYISEKGGSSIEYRMQTRDGRWRWVRDEAVIVKDEAGNAQFVQGVISDITERKLAEMDLLQFRKLMDEANDALYLIDPQTSRYIDFNRSAHEKLGYTREELSQLGAINIAEHVTNTDIWKQRVARVQEQEGLIFESNYRRKDGTTFPAEVSARMLEYGGETILVANVRDITERKGAENALRESEARLDAFFNQSLDGFFFSIFDKPQPWDDSINKEEILNRIFTNQRYTDVNNAILEQYGMTREKFLSFTSSDLFAHDPQLGLQLRRQLFDNGHLRAETFERRNDGTPVWFESEYACLYDEQKRITGFFGIQRDITKRKQAETALRESERQLMNSQVIAGLGSYSLDISTGIWKSSDVLDKIFGIDNTFERSIEGWAALIHPDDRQSMIDYFTKDVIGKSVSFDKEYRIVRNNDQTERWVHGMGELEVDAQSRLVRMFGTIQDITEGKRIEAEREGLIKDLEIKNAESETLRESFAAIVGTFEFIEIIQHILDQIKRAIPYDSASVWKVEGDLQKFISGRDLPSAFSDTDVEFITDETNSALPILKGEVPYILNNNVQEELADFKQEPHTYVNSWLAIPLKTRGKIIGLIALDGKRKDQFNEHHAQLAVTFANQVAIALENARLFSEIQHELFTREKLINELESKNTELERFTYTVSHDLKSPLVTINGFLGYLKGDAASGNSERVNKDIHRIQDAVDKMHLLLKDLLELSRIGRIMNPPQSIPFADLVSAALEVVHGRLEARGVTVLTQPGLPSVHGDRQRLMAVLQNLIDNAAKYMGDQTTPQIEIGQHTQAAEDGLPVFYVRDNGMGIPPQHYERIFGLFDKLDPKSEGTGVGLALVKRIIEVHGGRIWVDSEVGKGSTFYFTIAANQI